MNPFSAAHVEAIKDLQRVWPVNRLSLIGAAGLTCQMEFFHRNTADLDLVAAVSVDAMPDELSQLRGWTQKHDHHWRSPKGVKVDIIPAGPEHLAEGKVTWPSGGSMSLLGMRHAFDQVRPYEFAPGSHLKVATIATIALLKMIAFEERPHERERDLGDMAHILEYFVAENDARRTSDEVFEAGLRGEEVSAYLLGRELRTNMNGEERRAVEAFIARVEGEVDGGKTLARMLGEAPRSWRRDPELATIAIQALKKGLG